MKKFFTLFALLSVALSASADYYEPSVSEGETCVFYQVENHNYYRIYVWDGDGNNPTKYAGNWPGTTMEYMGTNANGKNIYKWTTNTNIPSTAKVLFTVDSEQDPNNNKTADLKFVNKGYYVDGNLLQVIGDTGYDVYFDNSNTGWNSDNVRVYAWADGNLSVGWPGITKQSIENNVIKFHIGANIYNDILFNDGGNVNKTADFTLTNGMTYTNNITLVEGQNFTYQSTVTASKAHYERTIALNEWGTLCLPFQIKGSNEYVTFYELSSVSSEAMTFAPITTTPIPAGTPMLFKRISGDGSNLWIEETKVEIDPTPNPVTKDGWTTNGTFTKLENQSNVYIVYGTQIHKGTSGITINPYRAWFTNTSASGAPLRIEEAGTEGLQYVEQEDGTVKAYFDLQGRKLDGARKGLVIENGKIIMVK
jgi:hypothetical protein